jgi:hypothetical protein
MDRASIPAVCPSVCREPGLYRWITSNRSSIVPARKCLSRAPDFGGIPILPQIPDQQIPIVERKRLSRGADTGGSPAVFGFLTAYGHARKRCIDLDMKGLCSGWPIPWVVSGRAKWLDGSGYTGQ